MISQRNMMFMMITLQKSYGIRETDEQLGFLPLAHVAGRMFYTFSIIESKAVVNIVENLETAVAVVLGFVGLKLGAGYFGYEVSTEASLAVIFLVLGAGVAASVLLPEEES